jgi:F-box and WD-40 domain protein 1/11
MAFTSAGNTSTMNDNLSAVTMSNMKQLSSSDYKLNSHVYLAKFMSWNEHEQVEFIENLLKHMPSYQHAEVNAFLSPMLQRDFLGCLAERGLDHVTEKILAYLDDQSLRSTELVCHDWYHIVAEGQ